MKTLRLRHPNRFGSLSALLLVCALAAAQDPAPPPPVDTSAALPEPAAAPPPDAPPPRPESNIIRKPRQVEVSVKIIEFQTTKGVETGLSAYFRQLPRALPFGQVRPSGEGIDTADLTFPTSTAAGITVLLDRIFIDDGEVEVVLQALVDENRAFILSQPWALVMVGNPIPTVIKTTSEIPYENTQVVGVVAQQITSFKDTGVTLTVEAPEMVDDDGDWATREDSWVRLHLRAEVREEGQRIVVALDDQLASGNFTQALNAIQVPEFVSRSIETNVWLHDQQVLILGGLYRNSESRSLTTIPWLTQAEDFAVGAAQRLIPGNFVGSPLSTTIGNRSASDTRRELVFLIKCKIWDESSTFASDLGFDEDAVQRPPSNPFTEIIESIADIPQGISDNVIGQPRDPKSVESQLGGIKP